MFNKKDMMVSVLVAEDMIKETQEKTFHKMLEPQMKMIKTINIMKEKANVSGSIILFKYTFLIGEKTPYTSKGFDIYTGDEVEFKSGKKGVVVKMNNRYRVQTNREGFDLIDLKTNNPEIRKGLITAEETIAGDNIAITKHVNELEEGEEYGKGRSGGFGFVVVEIK